MSCLTLTRLMTPRNGLHEPDKPFSVTFAGGEPVSLRTPKGRVLFEFVLHYVITRTDDPDRGPWKVSTRGYSYGISTPDGAEVVVWHWHPTSKVSSPHHHIGRAVVRPDAVVTSKHHLPSERVSAEAVIRYCIEDLKVRPRRNDWRTVLADSEDLFKLWRTWPNPAPSSATQH